MLKSSNIPHLEEDNALLEESVSVLQSELFTDWVNIYALVGRAPEAYGGCRVCVSVCMSFAHISLQRLKNCKCKCNVTITIL